MKAYYLFGKSPLPFEQNSEINQALKELSKFKNQEEYLKAAYELITKRFTSSRIKTVFKILDLFSTGVEDIWNRSGFLHCTNQNYLLSLLLVKGGLFKESDIKLKWTNVWYFSPHQYLQIKVGNHHINVDAWSREYGVKFGDYTRGFNSSLKKSRID